MEIDRDFLRSLFAPEPEDKPATEQEQHVTPERETVPDFLSNIFKN